MLEKLLGMADGQSFVALLVIGALITSVKGLFGLRRSTSQDRRDFLDLWSRRSADDLWLEVAVRHQFGEYLPASLIRRIQLAPQAGRALWEVSAGWDFLDMRDDTGEVHWRAKRHEGVRRRKWERRTFTTLYFVLAFIGLMLAHYSVGATSGLLASWTMWVYVVVLIGAAFFCLARAETLAMAERAMTRWLRTSPNGTEAEAHQLVSNATSSPSVPTSNPTPQDTTA